MSLDNFLKQSLSRWMAGNGPNNSVAISSRVRLARNLPEYPFPGQASPSQLEEVEQKIRRWWNTGGLEPLGATDYISIKDIPENERLALADKHLISPKLAGQGYGGVLLNKDESVSVMVNEEDHLRIQSLLPGSQLKEAWDLASQVDDLFDAGFGYAWSPHTGYLTCCPTNVGTGMRASIMLHLPGLAFSGQLAMVLGTISKVGIMVRGMFGEGSEAQGNIYQISNQITLGQREEDIIEALNRVTGQVIDQESDARKRLAETDNLALRDKVWRAYGILANARVIASSEAMEYISLLRLGLDLNIIQGLNPRILQELLVFAQPGYLQKIFNQVLPPRERDVKRAELIRELVKK
ncbi:MAG: protein arginine kinase [Eubacteriales bacterium]|jgi:protein arginine kinase|nr:protein arginine kinase [Eubacteriales bacterium]